MQIVIDITKMVYKSIKDNHDGWNNYICTAIRNGTVFPDNPTNGDMIKVLFPNAEIKIHEQWDGQNIVAVRMNDVQIVVNSLDWWNAPYRKDSE